MKPLLGLFLASCCFTCFGCGRGQGRLDGEVFIVTEGAQNIKLGLVEVRVLPFEETKTSIAKTKAQAERGVANLQPKLDAAREAMDSADRRRDAAASGSAMTRYLLAKKAVDATNAWALLNEQARHWYSGALYFESLPPSVASVKTDADGKFSIPLDRTATVALAANATRRLPNNTENYYWLVTVSLDGQPSKRIFLSNDNLATSDSKDSLVHVVE